MLILRECGTSAVKRTALALYLEDGPDGVVNLLKLLGSCAAQVLDEAAAGWTRTPGS